MKKIHTDNAPAAIGPYSQAIQTGRMLYTSGQIPADPVSGEIVPGGIEEQTRQVMRNLDAVLKAAGTSFEKVVKTTCFLREMKDFAVFNSVYAEYFVSLPARSCVQAAKLPKDVLCEVEVIAEV